MTLREYFTDHFKNLSWQELNNVNEDTYVRIDDGDQRGFLTKIMGEQYKVIWDDGETEILNTHGRIAERIKLV